MKSTQAESNSTTSNLFQRRRLNYVYSWQVKGLQGRIQDLIRGGAPDRDRPKTAIPGPQFCRILVLGPHFWWSGGGPGPWAPPGSAPGLTIGISGGGTAGAPQQDPMLSFSHMFLPKSTHIGGRCPPPMGNPGSATAYNSNLVSSYFWW